MSPHHTSQAERGEHKEEVLGPSSWAGWLTTPHLTITHHKNKRTQRRSSWAEFLGRMAHHTTSHHITHHKPKEENTKKKFLGRVLGPDGILTTSHIITSHHIRHHKPKVQAERAKKYEFYYENPVKDHPRPTKSTRITTKKEHRRS